LNILFENVNFESSSGPNGFAVKLSNELGSLGHTVSDLKSLSFEPDIQLSFISSNFKIAPIVQRLDGIYFNSNQDFKLLNSSLRSTYEQCEAVIFQTDFNKKLIESWFGIHDNSYIIRNGTPVDIVNSISPLSSSHLEHYDNIWTCASSWRPHKRLDENVKYFLEFSSEKDCLVIAGENPDKFAHPRIYYAGHLNWIDLISLFKISDYFLHLSWLDHCPNVVIDARVCGCHIICSSAGGTQEICGTNSTIIQEEEWDYKPVELYKPPKMDFTNTSKGSYESEISMIEVAKSYCVVFKSALDK